MEFDVFYFELKTDMVERYVNLEIERRNEEEPEKIIVQDRNAYIFYEKIRYYGFTEFEWDENINKRFDISDIRYDEFCIEFCKEKMELSPYEKIDIDSGEDSNESDEDIK